MSELGTSAWDQTSSDPELITAVRQGDAAAFGVLFERHADAARTVVRQYVHGAADIEDVVSDGFEKVLQVLRSGAGPDVAFRAYLFTVVRRIAFVHVDRARRTEPTDEDRIFESAIGPLASVEEPALRGFEDRTVARAFESLPERWRSVLWYTDIEGQTPAAIAPIFGLTANGVAALAYRAREGLRQAYLQHHVQQDADDGCARANPLLGAYARGGLSKRETSLVETHLDECGKCRALVLELSDIARSMKGVVAPLVLGLAGTGALVGGLPLWGGAVLGGATAGTVGTAGTTGAAGGSAPDAASGSAPDVASAAAGGSAALGLGAANPRRGVTVLAVTAGFMILGILVAGATLGNWFRGSEPQSPVASVAPTASDSPDVTDPADPGATKPEQGQSDDAPTDIGPDSSPTGTGGAPGTGPAAQPTVPAVPAAGDRPAAPVNPDPDGTRPSPGTSPTPSGPSSEPSATPGPEPTPRPDPAPTPGPAPTPDPSPSPDPAPSPPAVAADLAVTVDGLVALNDSVLRATVTNTARGAASDVVVGISLPDGATFASPAEGAADRAAKTRVAGPARVPADGDWECGFDDSAQTATCVSEELAPGASTELALDVTYTRHGIAEVDFPLTVSVGGVEVARSVTSPVAKAPAKVAVSVDEQSPLVAGQRGWLVAAITNHGEIAADGTAVEVALAQGSEFVSDVSGRVAPSGAPGWSCAISRPTTAVCEVATVVGNPGRSPELRETLTLPVRAGGAQPAVVRAKGRWSEGVGQMTTATIAPISVPLRVGPAASAPSVGGGAGAAVIKVLTDFRDPATATVTVTNSGERDIADLRLSVAAPDGISVDASDGPSHPGALSALSAPDEPIAVGDVAAGMTVTRNLRLAAPRGEPLRIDELSITAVGTPTTGPIREPIRLSEASAPVHVSETNFGPSQSFDGRISVTEVGAPLLFCDTETTGCLEAAAGEGIELNNDNHAMLPLDEDPCGEACGTLRFATSSSAELSLPAGARVRYVGLVWSAPAPTTREGAAGALDEAYVKVPGASEYVRVPAGWVTTTPMNAHYSSFADVTELVAPHAAGGSWSVANIAISPSAIGQKAQYAGWGLVVVYEDDDAAPGTVDVFTGGRFVNPSNPSALSFLAREGATGRIGAIAWEGDRGLAADMVTLNGRALAPTGALGDPANAFDSTATGFRYTNSLGVDAKGFVPVPLAERNELKFTSTQDAYFLSVLTVQTPR